MHRKLQEKKGLTLIELLVALVMSAVIIAALYRTFIGQQKTFSVQEQVVDMQQNARSAVTNMMRELRMAGFGNVGMILPAQFGTGKSTLTYNNIVNSNTPSSGWITIITALNSSSRGATLKAVSSLYQITVSDLGDFDTGKKKYISIGGVESNTVVNIDGGKKKLTLKERLIYNHPVGTRVYPIRAVSYQSGVRDENTGGGAQPLAENIESVQYEYLDAEGKAAAKAAAIQMIRVRIIAKTDMPDPQYKSGDGYRRREISSNIQLRNIATSP